MGKDQEVKPQKTKRKQISANSVCAERKKVKIDEYRSRSSQLPTNEKPNTGKQNKNFEKRKVIMKSIDDQNETVTTRSRSRSRSKSKGKEIHKIGETSRCRSKSQCDQNKSDDKGLDLLDYEDDIQNDDVVVHVPGGGHVVIESDDESMQQESDDEDDRNRSQSTLAEKIKKLKQDPQYQDILNQLTEEKVRGNNRGDLESNEGDMCDTTDIDTCNENNSRCIPNYLKEIRANKFNGKKSGGNHRIPNVNKSPIGLTKSPSDSTLYTPALRLETEQNMALNQISNFVENIRLESQKNSPSTSQQNTGTRHHCVRSEVVPVDNHEREREHQPVEMDYRGDTPDICNEQDDKFYRRQQEQNAKEITDKVLLDAEHFKASLVTPKGMLPIQIDSHIELLRKLDNDDDFFHVSCHIDSNLRGKIERGEFIELEKLLPRPRSAGRLAMEDYNTHRVELMMKDGHPYFGTPASENKINGVKKWDQAFRIYATIYTQANPHRSSEIWQYIDIIHTAANTYHWDNVAYYDFTFRQLMASKPWRSWAKTYTQGWNLALKDPSIKGSYQTMSASTSGSQVSAKNQQGKDWKENCCWRYNKNQCNKTASECYFDHRCTYCGIWNHSFYNCRERQRKNGSGNNIRSPPQEKGQVTSTAT